MRPGSARRRSWRASCRGRGGCDGGCRTPLALAALAVLIIGLARPRASLSLPRKEATIVLAIDTSRSMAATDAQPSRLAAALAAAKAFLQEVPEATRSAS